ncbi:nuclear transport factor 2 family protein [Marivirga sp. S37H4]|uniref:Nuclear transport factor 2 family protein n=1 Tax=Marivirga aurantiaca TaxID=2802615 RepID=A0A935CB35_9BACT|nr:nuclear transport factor 2 family protein [Marivirga aurantiaca]MBK6265153.1 nuclear transport factor 2 family protein [Marivirga aurantiaca]
MKITCKEDCENAPKKLLLKELNIAFGKGNVESILSQLTDDIIWEMVGDKVMQGKEEVAKELESMKEYTAVELNIDHIVTHGKTAACNGSFQMHSGDRYGFCDMYVFNNNSKTAKIKEMISYGIALKS